MIVGRPQPPATHSPPPTKCTVFFICGGNPWHDDETSGELTRWEKSHIQRHRYGFALLSLVVVLLQWGTAFGFILSFM